jgi:ribosome-associated protein
VKKTTTKTSSALRLAKLCREVALDKKAEDVLLLDVRKVSSVADFMLICSGNSEPQLKAIAEAITIKLREAGVRSSRHSGVASSRWLVLDYGDVLVHVFHPELRQKYALEQLWGDAKRVK